MEQSTQQSKIKIENLNELISVSTFCYTCGKCLTVCPTSLLGIFSPKDFLHNFINEGYSNIEQFIKKEKLFNCITCEKCMMVCPMVPNQNSTIFSNLIRNIREYGYYNGLIMEDLYQNSTHDEIMLINPHIQSTIEKLTNKFDRIRSINQIKVLDEGEIAIFAGCSYLMEDVFREYNNNETYIDSIIASIALLNKVGIKPVLLDTKCCGHDIYWIGNTESAKKLAEYNVNLLKKAKVKQIVIECAEGYYMWKYIYPKLVKGFNFEVYHLSEFLLKNNIFKNLIPLMAPTTKVTYHDPCRLGRFSGIYDSPRELLKNAVGVELIEMENIKEMANCCGVSLFLNCNSNTKRIRESRIKEAEQTEAEYLITTCPKCITHFNCFLTEYEKSTNSIHDKDLIDKNQNQSEKRIIKKTSKLKVMDLALFLSKRFKII